MSIANDATRFLVEVAQESKLPPEVQGSGPAGDDAQAAPAQRGEPRALVGSRVGAYLITKRLGAGGVGEVFKGVDTMLKREVAIKVLRDELACDPLFLERFRQEAQLHAKLSHPNVASLHAFLHEGDTQFMVMEYVPGISLDEFVRSGGPVPVERALSLFRKALDGIEHAHDCGIVHRDIKPANIMLSDSGQVKVMDFGIARALDNHEHLTRHGQVAGTARSMSPEQIRGRQADVRSDIYSLGIVLYTLLAGRAPFDGQNDFELMKSQLEQAPPPLRALVDKLPPKLEAAVMRALEKDPSARFQTVGDFAHALDACLADVTAASRWTAAELDVPTMSGTVVNAEPPARHRLPKAAAAKPTPSPAPLRPTAALRAWPRPRYIAGALALVALAGAAVLGLPRLMAEREAAAVVPSLPAVGEQVAAPVESAAAVQVAAVPAQQPDVAAVVQPPSPPPVAVTLPPPSLAIVRLPADEGAAAVPGNRFRPGERIRLRVTTSQDAHVYCYLQDEARRIVRFYPNRFSPSALVKTAAPLEIPGPMRFELVANTRSVTETVACFASQRDLMSKLPSMVVGTDFKALPVASLDQLKGVFARTAGDTLAQASFQVQFK